MKTGRGFFKKIVSLIRNALSLAPCYVRGLQEGRGGEEEGGRTGLDEKRTISFSHSLPNEEEPIQQSLPPSAAWKQVCLTMDIEEMSSWSNLPQCLLELILELLILSDRLRFGSVCRSWCTAQVQCLYPLAPQFPFLIFLRTSSTERSIEFFSLSEKRIYRTPMPDCYELPMDRVRCVSSSHGWLFFLSYRNANGLLFNPYSKKCIQLPCSVAYGVYFSGIFFSTPADPDGLVYVKEGCYRFALCSPKDPPRWSEWFIYLEKEDVISNTIFCGGKLYTLKDNWNLVVVDPLFPHYYITNVKMKNVTYPPQLISFRRDLVDHACILVESCGDILLVMIKWGNIHRCVYNLQCVIFQADLTRMEWVTVENLDDQLLFLTTTSSVSICASKTGCKGNRIYYIRALRDSKDYLEIEVDTNEVTIHSIPVDDATICEWFTPCLP